MAVVTSQWHCDVMGMAADLAVTQPSETDSIMKLYEKLHYLLDS